MVVDPRFEQDESGNWFWTIRNLGELGIGILDATARFPTRKDAEEDFLRWSDSSPADAVEKRFNSETSHGPVLVSARLSNAGAVVEISWGKQDKSSQLRYTFRGAMPKFAHESLTAEIVARMALSHFDLTYKPIAQTLYFRIGDIDPNGALRLIPLV